MKRHKVSWALTILLLVGISACSPTSEIDSEIALEPAISASEDGESGLEEAAESIMVPDNPDAASSTGADARIQGEENLCDEAVTQSELNICAAEAYAEADAELNRVYQALNARITDPAQQSLIAAETAWIDFRDRDCAFDRSRFAGGSIAPLIYNSCREDHTLARIQEIEQPAIPQLDYASADDQLNQAYQTMLGLFDSQQQEDLVDTQLAWIEYRDRSCAFEAAYHPAGMSETQCQSRLSEIRTQKIRQAVEQRSL